MISQRLGILVILNSIALGFIACDNFDKSFEAFDSSLSKFHLSHSNSIHSQYCRELISLLNYTVETYMKSRTITVLYEELLAERDYEEKECLSDFLHDLMPHTHGTYNVMSKSGHGFSSTNYITFLKDVRNSSLLGVQTSNRVVIVVMSNMSRFEVNDFLSSALAQVVVNMLLILPSKYNEREKVHEFLLYTHDLYSNANNVSIPRLLTTWRSNHLCRKINLFPKKMRTGFSGHRFIVASAEQPPFVITKLRGNQTWDGFEPRLLQLLSKNFNYTLCVRNVNKEHALMNSSTNAVMYDLSTGNAHIGIAGMYVTKRTLKKISLSTCHTRDCAVFISRAQLALPRYKAIMGPFHWTVWLALLITYLLAIFPLSFSHRHSAGHLCKNPWEMMNMFWYVFGTFTNLFTFKGTSTWTSANKDATKVFIGVYWAFSIIVSACYTGSIISFFTLPVYPHSADTSKELLDLGYKIATLGNGGWEQWFSNSSDPVTNKILKKIESVSNITEALYNVTKKSRTPYAFLGSLAWLDYILRENFTHSDETKRSFLHISSECFVPFCVAIGFPKNAPYKDVMNEHINYAMETGFITKIKRDVEWEVRRSAKGKLLPVSDSLGKRSTKPLDKILSLDDVQGTFLLLGAGFSIAFFSLFVECYYSFYLKCRLNKLVREIESSATSVNKELSPSSFSEIQD